MGTNDQIQANQLRGQIGNDKLQSAFVDVSTQDGILIDQGSSMDQTSQRTPLGQQLTIKLQDNAVNGSKVADNSLSSDKLVEVHGEKLVDATVTGDKIIDSTLTNDKLSNSTITLTPDASITGGGSISLGSAATIGQITGSVVQQAFTSTGTWTSNTSTIPLDDTIPQITEGTQLLTLSFTPRFATSKLLITSIVNFSASKLVSVSQALFEAGSANAIGVSWDTVEAAGHQVCTTCQCQYQVSSTSALTFSLRYGPSASGTAYVNGSNTQQYMGGSLSSSLSILETCP